MGQTPPFIHDAPEAFLFCLRDASSGVETLRRPGFSTQTYFDDAHRARSPSYNPPCSFNPHMTCPILLRENRLPVKILAGLSVHVALLRRMKQFAFGVLTCDDECGGLPARGRCRAGGATLGTAVPSTTIVQPVTLPWSSRMIRR